MVYDTFLIGAGTSNVFTLLELSKNKYKKKIGVVDKGKDPYNRKSNEVTEGFAGAGFYSDCKIILSTESGGEIENYLTGKELKELETKFLNHLQQFHKKSFNIIEPKDIDFEKYKPFEVIVNKTLHVGTDYSQSIIPQIYEHINNNLDVEFKFEEEVINITKPNQYYVIETNKDKYLANQIIYATGKSGIDLTNKIIENFGLKTEYKPVQLGVRVKVPYEITKKLTDKFYDFKFKFTAPYGEARSFCVAPQGNVIKENNYGDITYNGGSDKETKSEYTNFGIMCVPSIEIDNNFKYQREIVRKINNLPEKDNVLNWNSFTRDRGLRTILKDIFDLINDWCICFDKICPGFLANLTVYVPEVKYSSKLIHLTSNFNLEEYPNFWIAGDSVVTRGIFQSALTGIKIAEQFKGENKL